jgi:hypothetical protein
MVVFLCYVMFVNKSIVIIDILQYMYIDKLNRAVMFNCIVPECAVKTSVAEPLHFYAASAPDDNFDAAPAALAPAPTLLYSKAKFLKRTKVQRHIETMLLI